MNEKIETLKRGYELLKAHCAMRGIMSGTDGGSYINVALHQPSGAGTSWMGVRVFKDGSTAAVLLHDRAKFLMWHEVVNVLHRNGQNVGFRGFRH